MSGDTHLGVKQQWKIQMRNLGLSDDTEWK
jgi:hypothetical protein